MDFNHGSAQPPTGFQQRQRRDDVDSRALSHYTVPLLSITLAWESTEGRWDGHNVVAPPLLLSASVRADLALSHRWLGDDFMAFQYQLV